jgi:hypothetical protein
VSECRPRLFGLHCYEAARDKAGLPGRPEAIGAVLHDEPWGGFSEDVHDKRAHSGPSPMTKPANPVLVAALIWTAILSFVLVLIGAILGGTGVCTSEYRLRAENQAFPDQAFLVGCMWGIHGLLLGPTTALAAYGFRAWLRRKKHGPAESETPPRN